MSKQLLTQRDLVELSATLFKAQLAGLKDLIEHGVDPARVAFVADTERAIEAVQQLRVPTRPR